jgi:hypothetical protein
MRVALFAAYVACRHSHLGISSEAGPALVSSLSTTVYIIYQSAIGNNSGSIGQVARRRTRSFYGMRRSPVRSWN